MSAGYPTIPDWERHVIETAPSVLMRGQSRAMLKMMTDPLGPLDDQQADILMNLDPDVAVGRWLDYCGARVGEPRGGLIDREYRRIINGRRASSVARGTLPGIWRTWLLLSGANETRARIDSVGAPGEPVVYLEAEYDYVPTVPFLRRAGAVILDAVTYPFDVVAMLYASDSLRFEHDPGWEVASWAFQLTTDRD